MRWTLLLLLLVATAPLEADDVFLAGAASVDITPDKGVSLDGAISKNGPVTGVHDRLYSRALVMSDGRTTLAIVVNDSCLIERSVFDSAKQLVERRIGLPVNRMLMSATHSHAAPRAMHIGREAQDDAYHELLAQRMAEAVIRAHANLAPAKVGFASFKKRELINCRRFLCEPGSVGANPFGNAEERVKSVAGTSSAVQKPAGPVDPEVSLLSVRHDDGQPLAVLANFSVHYCGGYQRGLVSADYFGSFAARLEELLAADKKHPPPVAMMSNGTSGDTGAINRMGKNYPAFAHIAHAGRSLAEESSPMIAALKYERPDRLQMLETLVEFSVRRPDQERLQWARQLLEDPKSRGPHRWSRIFAHEAIELSKYPPRYSIKLQAIRIGGIGIAAIPCEVFAETGLAIKRDSPLQHTFTMELANGAAGYLPTPQQHEWGGYETWPARTSHLEIQAEPKIRRRILTMLQELTKSDNK